jgi:hypothetical protein
MVNYHVVLNIYLIIFFCSFCSWGWKLHAGVWDFGVNIDAVLREQISFMFHLCLMQECSWQTQTQFQVLVDWTEEMENIIWCQLEKKHTLLRVIVFINLVIISDWNIVICSVRMKPCFNCINSESRLYDRN